jgi:hypothetical protein
MELHGKPAEGVAEFLRNPRRTKPETITESALFIKR